MSATGGAPVPAFRHEALLYAGADDFAARAIPIIVRALEAEEPVLVAVDRAKIALLRDRLGGASGSVAWKDIRGIGENPARIIPVWRQFVSRHADAGRLWGFGEPIWAGRSPAGLIEAQRHEELLNLAFADADGFSLICPHDTRGLDAGVVEEALRSHPFVTGGGARRSASYPGLDAFRGPFRAPLDDPPVTVPELVVDGAPVSRVHALVADQTGVDDVWVHDLAIAIAAIADVADGLGRPGARLRVWREAGAILAQIGGLAPVEDALAGREWPPPSGGPTRGLWLANQICELVQLRSSDAAAVVRLHVSRARDGGRDSPDPSPPAWR